MGPLSPHREEVTALFGQCLLTLQQYELLMKELLARQSITSDRSGAQISDPKFTTRLGTSTLGLIVQEFFENFVVVTGTADRGVNLEAPTPTSVCITSTVRVEMAREDHEAAKMAVADLVDLRNMLAHHFIRRFNIWSESGCAEAAAFLASSCERIGRDLAELQGWARSISESRQETAALFETGVVQDFVFDGIAPDGVVDWSCAGIVARLVEAIEQIRSVRNADGWFPLHAAVDWLAANHPEQTPKRYGCVSWAQVLNDSKQFELMYERQPGTGRNAMFRSRPGKANAFG